ncbi:MAG: efflux RND transporter permease subunit, partial [candidate division KSB1 bacterium]|nr:efflux RND transporter permease subunit [candidate division KSB1 bacterium]
MNIIRFVIRRKILIGMLFFGAVLLGIVSYRQLPMELFPDAELPLLIVQVRTMQDLDPVFVEKQAIVPLEGAVSSLQGIESIESYVERNGGMIYVYFNKNVNIKFAYVKLDERIKAIQNDLDERFRVSVIKVDTEQQSNVFMSLQVLGGGGLERVREWADQKIVPELESIDGVANVQVYGGRERSVEIVLNESVCRAYGITPSQISDLIAQNAASKTFVGTAYDRDRRYFVNLVADYTDVDQLQNIIVRSEGPVRLRDIADVYFGVKEPTSISRVDGKDAVNIQLMRDSQTNLIALAHAARATIEDLNRRLAPFDIRISIETDTAQQIEDNIRRIMELALFGAVLAAAVLWLFLRNLRWVGLIALAIPVSVLTAFNFFYSGGISINSLTLVGLALAVGMLLDNSVVVMENIYRLLSRGHDPERAVVQGTGEVWRSIFAATLTTIIVFLPFIFAGNYLIRLIGRHIGISIVSTLLVSLLAALLLIPTMIHALLRRRVAETPSFQLVSLKNRMLQIYTVIFKSCMRKPAQTIIGAVLVFFISVLIALAVSVNVPQEAELREFNIYVTMPKGSSLARTDQLVAQIEEQLADLKEKERITSTINEEDAIVTVRLVEDFADKYRRSPQDIKDDVMKRVGKLPGGEISLQQPTSGARFRGAGRRAQAANLQRLLGIGEASERIVIKGSDFAAMTRLGEEIAAYLDEFDTIQRAGVSVAPDRPEVHLYLDPLIMEDYGVTPQQIASELAAFRSEFTSSMTFKQGDEEYEITIRGDSLEDKTLADLQILRISSSKGGEVALKDVSRIVLSQGMASIERINQEKQVEVNYSFLSEINDSKELLSAARAEVDELVAALNIPAGIAVEVVHEENDLSDVVFLIGVSFILIYMILASVFESVYLPVVMMFTIPLAAIGSLWALILTGNSVFNANTLIGFLILIGVVVNNGIIFIDYTQILRRRGFSRNRALLTAGLARVRPILITAITTIVGMVPLAMGKSEYVALVGAPFAITVIGGLSLSTLFTLVFIPTFYSGLENAIAWIRRQKAEVKLLEAVVWGAGCALIFTQVDNLFWRLFYLFAITVLVPASVYFVERSLRQADTKLVAPDEEVTITIRRAVKIYDRPGRFVREWQKGKVIRERAGLDRLPTTWQEVGDLIWQVPLLLFLVYFAYFYLQSSFWALVFFVVIYLFVRKLWLRIGSVLKSNGIFS